MKPFLDTFPALLPSPARASTGQDGVTSPLFLSGRINSFGRLVSVVADETKAHEGIDNHGKDFRKHGCEDV